MTAYVLATITINDRTGYAEYEAGFLEIFQRFKGRMLSVDESPTLLEGTWDVTRTVLIEFPSAEDARAWFDCDDYQALARFRHRAADTDCVLLAGFG